MSCRPPIPRVKPDVAKKTIALFSNHKKKVIGNILSPKNVIEAIEYPADVFLDLLTRLINTGNSGFRIYFACHQPGQGTAQTPPGMEDQLTLVYIPTNKVGATHISDLKNCCLVFGNAVHTIDITPADHFVRNWIKYYAEKRIPALKEDGMLFSSSFDETVSLWYDKANFGNTSAGDGLLDYIRCRIGETDNRLTSVAAVFGGMLFFDETGAPNPLAYKLTLIFQFRPPQIPFVDDQSYFSLSVGKKIREHTSQGEYKKKGEVRPLDDGDDDADTGNPCPPNVCDPTFP